MSIKIHFDKKPVIARPQAVPINPGFFYLVEMACLQAEIDFLEGLVK